MVASTCVAAVSSAGGARRSSTALSAPLRSKTHVPVATSRITTDMRLRAEVNSFTASTSHRSVTTPAKSPFAEPHAPVRKSSVLPSGGCDSVTTAPAALDNSLRPSKAAPVTSASSSGEDAWYRSPPNTAPEPRSSEDEPSSRDE